MSLSFREEAANEVAMKLGLLANTNAPEYFRNYPVADWLDGFTPAANECLFSGSDYAVYAQQNVNDIMVARVNRMGNGAVANALPIFARANND